MCCVNEFPVKDENIPNGTVKVSKIMRALQRHSGFLWEKQVFLEAKRIINLSSQVSSREFTVMPSGCHYNLALSQTNRYSQSFMPSSIRMLNVPANFCELLRIEKKETQHTVCSTLACHSFLKWSRLEFNRFNSS